MAFHDDDDEIEIQVRALDRLGRGPAGARGDGYVILQDWEIDMEGQGFERLQVATV